MTRATFWQAANSGERGYAIATIIAVTPILETQFV